VNQVTIDKMQLQERIMANHAKHREMYERAIEGYRKTVIGWFNEQVDRAKAGAGFETAFAMPKPVDHTADYEQILDMLQMSVEVEITLSHQEFAQYVRDDWGWKREFIATSSNYMQ
jgi:hypothetical protein